MVRPATRSVPCATLQVRLGARKIRRTADNRPQSKPNRPDLHRARATAPFRRELRLLALFRLPLSQSDAGATAILVDELDAGSNPRRRILRAPCRIYHFFSVALAALRRAAFAVTVGFDTLVGATECAAAVGDVKQHAT